MADLFNNKANAGVRLESKPNVANAQKARSKGIAWSIRPKSGVVETKVLSIAGPIWLSVEVLQRGSRNSSGGAKNALDEMRFPAKTCTSYEHLSRPYDRLMMIRIMQVGFA
jgi:hypothetical protein